MKLRCIIVDDEPVARKIIQEFADQIDFLEVIGQFENVLKADTFLQSNPTDLMFLDIEMPKLSGLNYLKNSNNKSLVILTTAFPEYAIEGYEMDIIDYLLKPIAFERFFKAAQKAKEYFNLTNSLLKTDTPSYLFIRSDKRIEKVELNEILYVESLGNYVTIYTEAKKIIAYLTMKGIESQVPANEFIKIHQSYLVHLPKINGIEGNEIKINGKSLPISRNYKEALMQIVDQRLIKR
jgi:DNA-binding LytR/AlgR family response regulator